MKTILLLASLAITACETPITVSYRTVTASYNKAKGLDFAAEHLRVLTQK